MNQIRIALAALALSIFVNGCANMQRSNNFQIKVSAPPGTKFSCKYEFGNSSGAISTVAKAEGYQTILDLPMAEGHCNITNETPGTVLKAAVFEAGRERFNFRTTTNTPSLRITRNSAGWKSEVNK